MSKCLDLSIFPKNIQAKLKPEIEKGNMAGVKEIIQTYRDSLVKSKEQIAAKAEAQSTGFTARQKAAAAKVETPLAEGSLAVEETFDRNQEVEEVAEEQTAQYDPHTVEGLEGLYALLERDNESLSEEDRVDLDSVDASIERVHEVIAEKGITDAVRRRMDIVANNIRRTHLNVKHKRLLKSSNILNDKNTDLVDLVTSLVNAIPTTLSNVEKQQKLIMEIAEAYNAKKNPVALVQLYLPKVLEFYQTSANNTVTESLLLNTSIAYDQWEVTSLAAVMEPRSKAPNSLLARIPLVHKFLEYGFLFRALTPKGFKETANRLEGRQKFSKFRESFEQTLHDEVLNTLGTQAEQDEQGHWGAYQGKHFLRGPLHFLRSGKTGKLNANVVTAMAAEALGWVGTSGGMTVAPKTIEDYKQLLSIDTIDAKTLALARTHLKNFGSMREMVAQSLGQAIVKHLNLRQKNQSAADAYFEKRLATSLGLAAIAALEKQRLITMPSVSRRKFREIQGAEQAEIDAIPSNEKVYSVKLRTYEDELTGEERYTTPVNEARNAYSQARHILEKIFNIENKNRRPLTTAEYQRKLKQERKSKKKRKIRKSSTTVDPTTTRDNQALEGYTIKFQPQMVELFHAFPSIESFRDNIMEYIDLDLVLDREKDGQAGKNLSTDNEVATFVEALGLGDEEGIHFLFSTKRNHRSMVDSNGLNYQSGKGLHRFATHIEEWTNTINASELKTIKALVTEGTVTVFGNLPEGMQELLSATAMALDIKVPTDPNNPSNNQGIDKVVTDGFTYKGIWEALQKPVFQEAIAVLKSRTGKLTEEQAAIIGEATKEGGERSWSLVALDTIAKLETALEEAATNDQASLQVYLPMEVDGLTNGIANQLMQFPDLDPNRRWEKLQKVGVYKLGSGIRSFGELLRKVPGVLDFYQEFAVGLGRTLNEAVSLNLTANPKAINTIKGIFASLSYPSSTSNADEHALASPEMIQEMLVKLRQFSSDGPGKFLDDILDADGNPTKFARNMGKQPTMTSGGYGAGRNAVKNQIAVDNPYGTAPIAMFYKKLRSVAQSDLSEDAKAESIVQMINNIRDAANVDISSDFWMKGKKGKNDPLANNSKKRFVRNFTMNGQSFPEVTKEQILKKGVWKFAKEYGLPDQAEVAIQNQFKETYGEIGYSVLEKQLGPQHEARNMISNTFSIIAKANEYFFLKKYNEAYEANGQQPLSEQQIKQIHEELREMGVANIVPHPNSKLEDRSTWLDFGGSRDTAMESWHRTMGHADSWSGANQDSPAMAQIGVKTGIGKDAEGKPVASMAHSVRMLLPDANEIGIKGFVRLIQSMDAAQMASLYSKKKIFHIFDAFLTGTKDVREVGTTMNEIFLNRNKEFKALETVYNRLQEVENLLGQEVKNGNLTPEERANIVNFPKARRNAPESMEWTFGDFQSDFAQLITNTEAARQDIFDNVSAINQFGKHNAPFMANQSAVPAGVTLGSDAEVAGTADIFTDRYSNTIEQANFANIVEDIQQLENAPLAPEYEAHLARLREFVLAPGMAGVDRLLLNIRSAENAQNNRGDVLITEGKPTAVEISVAESQQTNPIAMSLNEVFHHELVHGVLHSFIEGSGDIFARNQLQDLFNRAKEEILPSDFLETSNPTQVESEMAQARYDYIFNNPKGHELHEFAAIGLTNPQFGRALSRIQVSKKTELMDEIRNVDAWKSGFVQQLVNVLVKAFSWVNGNKYGTNQTNVNDALFSLAQNVTRTNQKMGLQLAQRMNDRINETSEYANQRLKDLAAQGVALSAGLGWQSPEQARGTMQGTKAYIKYMQDIWKAAQAGTAIEKAEGMAKEAWRKFNFGQELVQEIGGLSKKDNILYRNIKRMKDTFIDELRKTIESEVSGQIRDGFSRELNKPELRAANELFLRTGVSNLLGTYSNSQIQEFMTDSDVRQREIRKIEGKLWQEFGRNGNVYKHQAKSLGMLIAKGQSLKDVKLTQTNAHNIAHLRMFEESDRRLVGDLDQAEQMITQLHTLHAINYTDQAHVQTLAPLMREEAARADGGNGFTNILEAHQAFKELSLEKNFNGNKIGTFAGYTAEDFDSNVDIAYAPISPDWQAKMREDNYVLKEVMDRHPEHARAIGESQKTKVGLYVSTVGLARYREGTVTKTNPHSRGTTIKGSLKDQFGYIGEKRGEAIVEQIVAKEYQNAKWQYEDSLRNDDPSPSNLIPIYSQKTGELVDLRYMMSDAHKQKYLRRQDSVDANLGRMFGKIEDKENTKSINRQWVDSVFMDWQNLHKADPKAFTYIGIDSKDKAAQDMYRMLPSDTQEYVKQKFGIKGMYIRKEMYNYSLGFREVSVANSLRNVDKALARKFGGSAKLPVYVIQGVRVAEDIWKEIISFARVKTSVLLPDVVIGNLVSNMLVLGADGIPPNYVLAKSREGIVAVRQYQKDRERKNQLVRAMLTAESQGKPTQVFENQIKNLDTAMAANPVKALLDEGGFQSIVEDVNPNSFEASRNQPIQRMLGNLGSKISERNDVLSRTVKGARELMVTPGSRLFSLAMAGNQYGDFVGRYVMYQHELSKGTSKQDAIDKVLDYFIYYNEPTNKHIAAVNDYGIFMFWKFYARIQRVVFRLFRDKPATATLSAMLDHTMFGDVGITGYFGDVERAANRITLDPVTRIDQATGMPLLEWANFMTGG